MASNYWDEILKRYQEQSPNDLPEDFALRIPDSIRQEFTSRIPDPYAGLPESPAVEPEISVEGVPTPDIQTPDITPTPYDVDLSNTTVPMKGRPESLPSALPSVTEPPQKPRWELEEDIDPIQEVTPLLTPDVTPTLAPDMTEDTAAEDAVLLQPGADNDKARREAELAAIEKKRKLNIIPQTVAGIGDAISASASAFGGNAPGGSMQRMIERQDKQRAQETGDIEVRLRNDAKSDVSKQYQNLLAQMMQKDPQDTAILGLTANQIAEKIPTIEKMMQRRSDEEMKRLTLEAAASKGRDQTTAQKAVDKAFGKDYAEYVAGGGYADTMTQIGTLEGVLAQLRDPKGSNLTGGGLSMLPEGIRKRTFSDSMAAQQAVEQSVQRTLKKTLGGQFTEKEGILFMQRGYDPALDEKDNAEKLERAINQLKLMALAKQEAIDWYEQNDTLDGFKGTFYTLKDGQMVKATKDDFLQMMTLSPAGIGSDNTVDTGPRKTKSGYDYTVG